MSDCGRCWKCREGRGCIRGVRFGVTNLPSHDDVTATVAKEGRWDEDMPAYKRLRANGLQPKRIDNCAELEGRADEQFEVEMAQLVPENRRSQVKDGLAIAEMLQAPVVERHGP